VNAATKSLLASLGGLAVAGGLVAWAFYGVHGGEERESQRKEVADRVFSAAAEVARPPDGGSPDISFTSFDVVAKGETTRLERREGAWSVVTPLLAPADRFAVDALSSQLQTAKFKAVVEEAPDAEALKKYGLDAPRFAVTGTATFPDGSTRTVKLEAGIDNPFDGSVFMRRDGDKAVYAAEGGLRYALEKNSFDLRDKELFSAVEEAKLTGVRVRVGDNAYELERVAGAWQLKSPLSTPADGTAVTSLVASLRGERAQAFPEDSEARRKALGLDAPRAEATFTREGGEPVRARFVDGEGGRVLALVEAGGSAQLAELQPSVLAALDKNPADLRDKSVLSFKPDAAARVSVFANGGSVPTLVLAKARAEDGGVKDTWELAAPTAGPAKTFKATAWVYGLSSLKAQAFGEASPKDGGKTYGLSADGPRVEVADAAGKPLATLLRGKGSSGGRAFARGTRDQVLEVDGARLQELFPAESALLDTPAPAPDAGTAALK